MKKITCILSILVFSSGVIAQSFSLPKLNYSYKALEPFIDAETMEIHHSKHHQAYVMNLNKALIGSKLEKLSLENIILNASKRSLAIRNNGGGHYNHSLFWEILSPEKNTKPSDDLLKAINTTFLGLDSLKKMMNDAAATRFGSGWAWLILTPNKKLQVCSTPNQDNPIMDVSECRGIPIIGIDVWEHAYYLKYQNKRGDYLGAIWNVIDWNAVSKRYAEALESPLLKIIQKDSWEELKEFHSIMSQTFHPAEENNLEPIKSRAGEMTKKALELKNSEIPEAYNNPKMKKAIEDLFKGTLELNMLISKKSKDEEIKDKLTKLHDTFHIIQGLCSH
jgi:superoxide dismutase